MALMCLPEQVVSLIYCFSSAAVWKTDTRVGETTPWNAWHGTLRDTGAARQTGARTEPRRAYNAPETGGELLTQMTEDSTYKADAIIPILHADAEARSG